MAPSLMHLFLLLAMSSTVCSSKDPNVKATSMVVYLQDVSSGPNATFVPVIGIQGRPWSYTSFGTIFSVDDPITQFPDARSPAVGRAQGIIVTSSLDGSNALFLVSIVFTSVEYNGSTLELQGNARQFDRTREIGIVSGTGAFRLARGFAVMETIYFDPTRSYAIIRFNITLVY